jgi:Bacterial lectin
MVLRENFRGLWLLSIFVLASIGAKAVLVTFQVDMSQMVISPNGVHLAGDFQGWDPATYQMTDIGGGIYSMTLDLAPGTYQFKFINGNSWGNDEIVPVSCGIDGGLGVYNREVIVAADATLTAFCFGQCTTCGPASYVMNGNASSLGGDCYQVTPGLQWQNGAFWSNTQIDLNVDFDLQFNMNLGSVDTAGADGVVFVLQRLGSNVIGASGGGMGYSSFGTSLGIEFDTFENPEYGDPDYDHIAIEMNGDVAHFSPNNLSAPVKMSASNSNTEDGMDHIVGIHWNAGTQTISVYFDCVFRTQATFDLANNIFGGENLVFWGFTGATGLYFNQQMICAIPSALSSSEIDICPGSSTMLNAGASVDGIYNWTPITYLDNPSIVNPTATPDTTTTYQVSYLDLCNVPITKVIKVNVLESGAGCFLLPVELISFDANILHDQLHFEWYTSSEWNSEYFFVEESFDGATFQKKLRHDAAGFSLVMSHYEVYSELEIRSAYYRLCQSDQDGTYRVVSPMVYVKGNDSENVFVWFNQSNNELRLIGDFDQDDISLEIFQSAGQLILSGNLGRSSHNFVLPNDITGGFYFAVVSDKLGQILSTTKFIVH